LGRRILGRRFQRPVETPDGEASRHTYGVEEVW
jgi:hypothetical protein